MKILLISIILITSSFDSVYCKNYAILISGGHGIVDNPENPYHKEKTAYWYDLVLAYEYLIEKAGYEHDEILVFFGDGKNWEDTEVNDCRYKLSERYPNWPAIVDYPNDEETVESVIKDFADNTLTAQDNLLIWLPRGHGSGTAQFSDDYSAIIIQEPPTPGWYLSEKSWYSNFLIIYNIFKFVDLNNDPKYKRIKYLISACRSGHLITGNKTLMNRGNPNNEDDDMTFIITGSAWDQVITTATIQGPIDTEMHSGFTYAMYCTLMGEDVWGREIDGFYPDENGDGVISLAELYHSVGNDINFRYISWDDRGDGCHPQLVAPCDMDKYLYIDENLKLQDATLELMNDESIRYYRVDNITTGGDLIIPNDSNIEFVVDSFVKLKPGFHAQRGSSFRARFGEIECP